MFRINRWLAVAVSLMVAVVVLSACGKAETQPALSGTWAADVSFGNATLTVNKDGTLVTGISFEYDCGEGSLATGSIGATEDGSFPGWPIDEYGDFAFENTPLYNPLDNPTSDDHTSDPAALMSFSGSFTSDGKSASGAWGLTVNDTRCSADWTSTR